MSVTPRKGGVNCQGSLTAPFGCVRLPAAIREPATPEWATPGKELITRLATHDSLEQIVGPSQIDA
jgi:hypothetical protein